MLTASETSQAKAQRLRGESATLTRAVAILREANAPLNYRPIQDLADEKRREALELDPKEPSN